MRPMRRHPSLACIPWLLAPVLAAAVETIPSLGIECQSDEPLQLLQRHTRALATLNATALQSQSPSRDVAERWHTVSLMCSAVAAVAAALVAATNIARAVPSSAPAAALLTGKTPAAEGTAPAPAAAAGHTSYQATTSLGPLQLVAPPLQTAASEGLDVDIHELFSQAEAARPNQVALLSECEDTSALLTLTYTQLQQKVRALAAELLSRDILGAEGSDLAPGQMLVAVCLRRAPALVVAILASIEAGAAYVPIEPSDPEKRRDAIVELSGAALIVIEAESAWTGHLTEERSVRLKWPEGDVIAQRKGAARVPKKDSLTFEQKAAYVIFTSGSTGGPKGVVVPRRSLVNVLRDFAKETKSSEADVLVSVSTCCFDISVLEIFLPLCFGFRLALASAATASKAEKLIPFLESNKATLFQATPATFTMLLNAGWKGSPGLRVIAGGDAWTASMAKQLPVLSGRGAWNGYGPTETTIYSTKHVVTTGQYPVPIGRPIAGTVCLVVPCEAGEKLKDAGELLIGGAGVTFGYHRRPDLTAERFVTLPSAPGLGNTPLRVYKTGDLVQCRKDSPQELIFLGRIDSQVKIRGFRIELGEVESTLELHPLVKAATAEAVTYEDENKELVAFVQLKPAGGQKESDIEKVLQEHCSASLPSYMVPQRVVILADFPTTSNNKVDLKALRAQGAQLSPASRPASGTEALPVRFVVPPLQTPSYEGLDGKLLEPFTRVAAARPDEVAFVSECEDTNTVLSLTYSELLQKVRSLAAELRARDVSGATGSDLVTGQVLVPVCLRRAPALVVGILGALEAGAAYVPLEPSHPEQRRESIVELSGAAVIIVEAGAAWTGGLPEEKAVRLKWPEGDVVVQPRGLLGAIQTSSWPQEEPKATCLLFTSGSTGTPKGVLVPRKSIVHQLRWFEKELQLSQSDVLVAVATCCFDISIIELLMPLRYGLKLALASAATARGVDKLMSFMETNNATIFQATPVTFTMLINAGWKGSPGLRIFSGGEAWTAQMAARLPTLCGRGAWNVYGPTETTIWATKHDVMSSGQHPVPIGRPLAGNVCMIVPCEAGEELEDAGELLIGGDNVTFGYHRRPDLTAKSFITLPATPGMLDAPMRVYRTGDLVRCPKDGNRELHYVGRIDCQVKIRGFRIELGEVEATLAKHPSIKAAVAEAVAHDDGVDKELVAFVQLHPSAAGADDAVLEDELQTHASMSLPPYMVPRRVIIMPTFPLTATNKVDRIALRARAKQMGPSKTPRVLEAKETVDSLGFSKIMLHEEHDEQEVLYRCYTFWMMGIIMNHWFVPDQSQILKDVPHVPGPLWFSIVWDAWSSSACDLGLMLCVAYGDARVDKGRLPQVRWGPRDVLLGLSYLGMGLLTHWTITRPPGTFLSRQHLAMAPPGWHGLYGAQRWFIEALLGARLILWLYQKLTTVGLRLPPALQVASLIFVVVYFTSDGLDLCKNTQVPLAVKHWYAELLTQFGFPSFCPLYTPEIGWFATFYAVSFYYSHVVTDKLKGLLKGRFDGTCSYIAATAMYVILALWSVGNRQLAFIAVNTARDVYGGDSARYQRDLEWWRVYPQILVGVLMTFLLAYAMSGVKVSLNWQGSSVFAAYVGNPYFDPSLVTVPLQQGRLPWPLSAAVIVLVPFLYLTVVSPFCMFLLRLIRDPKKTWRSMILDLE